jgi:hypothetical protein
MDSANIQLLVRNLKNKYKNKNINLYTIHDCFASTPDFMSILNNEVKIAFIQLYFDSNYIETMHNSFLKQIESFTTIFKECEKINNKTKVNYYIFYKNKKLNKIEKFYIPDKQDLNNWDKQKEFFIEGIKNSLYFIN